MRTLLFPPSEALSKWLTKIDTHCPGQIALGLERISKVAQRMDLVTFQCPVITVAGTNGKGSCVAAMEAFWLAAGYQVGAYTSPHLLRYNERVRVGGDEVTDLLLCEAFEEIEQARVEVPLTYFEYSTLAALWIFKQAKLDAIILEVGLGGRLDAVNVVDPDVAVLTSVSLDHTRWLGDTREAIGYEKAGIFRSDCPAVCAEVRELIPDSVVSHAVKIGASLFIRGEAFDYSDSENALSEKDAVSTWVWYGQNGRSYQALPVPKLLLSNVSAALMVVDLLQDRLPVSENHIQTALGSMRLAGRWQYLPGQPVDCWLDVSHNPAGVALLAERLSNMSHSGKTLAVFGMLADKAIEMSLKYIVSNIDEWFIAELPVERTASSDEISKCLKGLGVGSAVINGFKDCKMAYRKALNLAEPGDKVIVFGSFYTVAEVILECSLENREGIYHECC